MANVMKAACYLTQRSIELRYIEEKPKAEEAIDDGAEHDAIVEDEDDDCISLDSSEDSEFSGDEEDNKDELTKSRAE